MRIQVRIKAILFDKDGTIFSFQESWGNWFFSLSRKLADGNNRDLEKIFIEFDFDNSKKKFNIGSKFASSTFEENIERFKRILPSKSKKQIMQTAIESTKEINQIPVTNLTAFFLNLKSRNLLLGVVTNDLEETTINQLKKNKIYNFFDYIVGSNSGYGAKPEPGQLNQFCKRFKIKPSNVMMVGDTLHDLIAGKKAKMNTVGVLTGIAKKSELLLETNYVVNDISEILKIMDDSFT
tara:strand:- start:421 stop:1131 length:711 start_codon:yes stop_codon:yes gene_type:complete